MREFSPTSKLTTCISSSPAKPKPNTTVPSTKQTSNKSKIADARWQRIASNADCVKPATRNKHAACFHAGYIYVYGGRDDCKQALKDFWRYNLMTSVWQCLEYTGDQLPHLEEHTIVAHKNFLLIFGGSFDSDVFESPLWLYNIELKHMSKQITEKDADRPSCRRSHTAVIYSDNMYIFGGFTDIHGSTDELWSYCPVTEMWKLHKGVQTSVKSPGPRHGHTSVVHQNAMWVYGGMENLVFKADLWKWDFELLCWSRIRFSSGPSMLTGHTACVIANNMFVVGGENAGELQDYMWTFNFGKPSWQKTTYFGMAPRSYHAMITIMPPTSDGDQTPTETSRSTSLPVLRAQKHQQVSLAMNRNRPRTSPAAYQYGSTSNADEASASAQTAQQRSVVFHNRISPNVSDFDDDYDGDDDSDCDFGNFYNNTNNVYNVDLFSDQTPMSKRRSGKKKLKRKDAVSDAQGYAPEALYGDMVEMKLLNLNISTNNDDKPLLDYASGSAHHRSSDFHGKLDAENPSYCDSLESLDNKYMNFYQNVQPNNKKTDSGAIKGTMLSDHATMFVPPFSHSDNPDLNLSCSSGPNFDIFQVNSEKNASSNICAHTSIRNDNGNQISPMSSNTDGINVLCPIILHDLDAISSTNRTGVRRSFTADDLVVVDLEGSNSPSMVGSPEKICNTKSLLDSNSHPLTHSELTNNPNQYFMYNQNNGSSVVKTSVQGVAREYNEEIKSFNNSNVNTFSSNAKSIISNNDSCTIRPKVTCQSSSNSNINVKYSADSVSHHTFHKDVISPPVITVQPINPASPQAQHLPIPYHDIVSERMRVTTVTLSSIIPQEDCNLHTGNIDDHDIAMLDNDNTRQNTPDSSNSDTTIAQNIDKNNFGLSYCNVGTNKTGNKSKADDLSGTQISATVPGSAESRETALTVSGDNLAVDKAEEYLDDKDDKDQSSNEYIRNLSDMFNTTFCHGSAVMIVLGGRPKDQEPFSVRNIHMYQCSIP